MPNSKKQAGRQIQPSDKWGMTRDIMGMCLTLQGMEKKQRPVEIAGNLMMAHPLSPFRQQVKQLLCCPPEALWLRLGQVLHEVLQLAIAYECQGLEWNFSGVLSDITDEFSHLTEPGDPQQRLCDWLQLMLDPSLIKAKAKAKSTAAQMKPKAQTAAASVIKVKAPHKARPRAKATVKAKSKANVKGATNIKIKFHRNKAA